MMKKFRKLMLSMCCFVLCLSCFFAICGCDLVAKDNGDVNTLSTEKQEVVDLFSADKATYSLNFEEGEYFCITSNINGVDFFIIRYKQAEDKIDLLSYSMNLFGQSINLYKNDNIIYVNSPVEITNEQAMTMYGEGSQLSQDDLDTIMENQGFTKTANGYFKGVKVYYDLTNLESFDSSEQLGFDIDEMNFNSVFGDELSSELIGEITNNENLTVTKTALDDSQVKYVIEFTSNESMSDLVGMTSMDPEETQPEDSGVEVNNKITIIVKCLDDKVELVSYVQEGTFVGEEEEDYTLTISLEKLNSFEYPSFDDYTEFTPIDLD